MKANYVYIVTAYRYGNREKHSYIVGAFYTPEKAIKEAELEEEFRGGKYSTEVLRCKIGLNDGQDDFKKIKELN